MKTTLLLNSRNYFSFLIAVCVLSFMSSCSNSKYTASFQNVPSKSYAHAEKITAPDEAELVAQEETTIENIEVPKESLALEIPEDFSASLKEIGVSEKKAAKIQKRLENLNEALVKAETDPASVENRKMNFAEKIAVNKAMKKAEKFLAENDIKDVNDVEKVQQTNSNIRIGLILILVGIVAGIFIWPVGVIVGSIGLVFLILGLIG